MSITENEIKTLGFLNNYEIDILKVPKYPDFMKVFKEPLNKSLLERMMRKDWNMKKFDSDNRSLASASRTSIQTNIIDKMFGDDLFARYENRMGLGRFYAKKSGSICDHPRVVKGTIFKHQGWVDVDMKKGHPSILVDLCELNGDGDLCESIAHYINNTDDIFKDMDAFYGEGKLSRSQKKWFFNLVIYGGGKNTWFDGLSNPDSGYDKVEGVHTITPFMESYIKDVKNISKNIIRSNPIMMETVCTGSESYLRKERAKVNTFKTLNDGLTKREIDDFITGQRERRVISYVLTTIENEILYEAYQHLSAVGILQKGVGALEKDGLCFPPLRKFDEVETITNLNEHTLNTTGFSVKWDFKVSTDVDTDLLKLQWEPSDPDVLTQHIMYLGIRDIIEACCPLFKSLIYCNNKWWLCRSDTNLWGIVESPAYYIVGIVQRELDKVIDLMIAQCPQKEDDNHKAKSLEVTCAKMYRSGVSKSCWIAPALTFLKYLLCNNNFSETIDCNHGYMAFKNGIVDMSTGDFRQGLLPTDLISFTIDSDYEKVSVNRQSVVWMEFLKVLNNNHEHLDYFFSIIGHSLTGFAERNKSIYFMIDGTENSQGDNGKTFLFKILSAVFGGYVSTMDSSVLVEGNTKTHKSIAGLRGKRLVYMEEFPQKKVNAELLKLFGEGGRCPNEVMFGTTEMINIQSMFYVLSNHIPKIDSAETAVYNRFKQISFGSHFDRTGDVEEDVASLQFIADTEIGERILASHKNEVIAFVLEYAKKFFQKGLFPIPLDFIKAQNMTKDANDPFLEYFEEELVRDEDGCVSLEKVIDMSGLGKDVVKKGFKRMGFKYDPDRRGLGKNGVGKFYKGAFIGCSYAENNSTEQFLPSDIM